MIKIREDNLVNGINIRSLAVKTTAYADDLTVFMDGSETSLRRCMEIFVDFENISGLSLNRQKSKVMWIGDKALEKAPICEDLDLSWTKGPID